MATNLLKVFTSADLKSIGKPVTSIVSLAFKTNKKNGSKIARAVLDNGSTLIKTISASGVISESIYKLPEILTVAQRNAVIKDLVRNQKLSQETVAAMLDISQATVSNVLRKM